MIDIVYVKRRKIRGARKFNGKLYVRVGAYSNKQTAEHIKNNYHGKQINALIIPSGQLYQVWARKR